MLVRRVHESVDKFVRISDNDFLVRDNKNGDISVRIGREHFTDIYEDIDKVDIYWCQGVGHSDSLGMLRNIHKLLCLFSYKPNDPIRTDDYWMQMTARAMGMDFRMFCHAYWALVYRRLIVVQGGGLHYVITRQGLLFKSIIEQKGVLG